MPCLDESGILRIGDIIINRYGNAGIAITTSENIDVAVVCGFVFRVTLRREYDPYYVVFFQNILLGRM